GPAGGAGGARAALKLENGPVPLAGAAPPRQGNHPPGGHAHARDPDFPPLRHASPPPTIGTFRPESRSMPRIALLTLCLIAAMPAVAEARGLEGRDLAALERVSSPTLSPDGRHLVFAQRSIDLEANSGTSALYVRNLVTRDMAPPKRLTPEGWNVNSPAFSTDGETVYFLSAKDGSQQLYAIPLAGGEPRQLTAFAMDVGTYHVSPDGGRVAFSADTFGDCGADFACTKQRLDARKESKVSGVVYDQLFVRHWDTWNDGRRNRLFVAGLPAAGAKPVAAATAISAALEGDVPGKPFGGAGDYAWAPDGGSIVASVNVAGREEAWSTNYDLFRLDAAGSAAPVNLTADNKAWDAGPVFSADGTTLFYRAM